MAYTEAGCNAAGTATGTTPQRWIAMVQAGMLVGKYPIQVHAGEREATRMAVADGRGIEVYEVDPQTSPDPPLGTEVEPALWGWVRVC
jgi:hypothetical protein